MSFAAPLVLLALVALPLVIAAQGRAVRRRAHRRLALAQEGLVVTEPAARRRWAAQLPFALFTVALALLVVGSARPQLNLGLPIRQGTVILAFDSSNSMRAEDVAPSRLEAAKAAAVAFVDDQPAEIRIGVVAFGDGAAILQPPTTDRPDVLSAIGRLQAQGGTSVGQGLFVSLNAINGTPLELDPAQLSGERGGAGGGELDQLDIGYFGSATIVLLSDGENTGEPDPLAVAELASVAGTTIHTVGLGDPAGTVLEIDGFSIATALDETMLRAVAETSGGTYSPAADGEALAEVYDGLDLEFVANPAATELTALFAGAGAVLLVLAAALSLRWFGRVV